ncbi:MAG TPA: carbohydrate binding family 9 domain-containing protein [Pyrinomonadaceae bacterium]|nr:carbohydrate binding family 9 domain-containing protein [Pyrinomonadaceae bacterium]
MCQDKAQVSTPSSPTTSPSPTASPKTAVAASAPNDGPLALSRYVKKDAPVRIVPFEKPPVIDGKLDDEVWKTAPVFGDFLQTQPGDNVPPSDLTEVMIGYDAKNLYVAFRAKQSHDKIRATVGRRDNVFSDDFVGMYIDTFNDRRQAYFIFLNPLGIQGDGVMTETNGEDQSVDLIFESKGVIGEDGYTVEAAIPFKSLRYEAGKDKLWGIHLFRRIRYNNNELDSWMPNNRSISGTLNQEGHITGLEGIETTRQLEIIPSITLSESGRRTQFTFNNDPAGRYRNDGIKADLGFTAKFGLTPTTTLDFAYNPDFAQVEADAPVITANQRFPIFFPEKRPFFLERIDIFRSPLNLVNTRSIVDPDVAAKITGRQGKNTFGVLYASDKAPGNFSKDERETLLICEQQRQRNTVQDPNAPFAFCDNERAVDKNASIGVARFRRDVGKESNLGFFGTTYNFTDLHNHTGGFDGRIRTGKKYTTEFQIVGTNSRRYFYDPVQDKNVYRTGNGLGYDLWFERAGRNLYMNYLVIGRSADYRADVGFTQRVDTNYAGSYIRYQTDQNGKKNIIYKRLQNATNISYDWRGRGQYFISDTQVMLALQKQTFVGIDLQFGHEWDYEHEFGAVRTASHTGAFFGPSAVRSAPFKAVQAFIESTPSKKYYLYFFLDYTAGIMDYDFGAGPRFPRASAAYVAYQDQLSHCNVATAPLFCATLTEPGLDPGPGNQLTLQSTFRWQPTTPFQTQLDFNKRRLVRHDTGLVAFDDNIFSSRTTYQFTRNTFARLRLDYSTLSRHIRPQFVLGWTPNPGTAFYVGYTDDVSYNGFNPYTSRFEPGFHGNGRTFFIKASYWFKKSF